MSRLNDASVNASIRLYLRVMIIMRQERHNKRANEEEKDDGKNEEKKEFTRGNEIVGMKFTFFL